MLERMAALLELKGENPFKVRAYANVSRLVPSLPDLEDRIASGTLTEVKGIGAGLADVINGLWKDGSHPALRELEAQFPSGLLELFGLPGLGPKKIRVLHDELHIASPEELNYAIYENRLLTLPGFGKKTQENLATALARLENVRGRLLLDAALERSASIRSTLPKLMEAGELRRRMPVVPGLEFLAPPGLGRDAIAQALPDFSWTSDGDILRGRTPGDAVEIIVRLCRANPWRGLFEATGNAEHLRQVAARGPLPADPGSEEALYAAAGLPRIPPEMREGRGEVKLAAEGRLADVISEEDLRGCFHNHTVDSDGASTLEEMRETALSQRWKFLGIADHSRSAKYARGLEPERLLEQVERIHGLNDRDAGFRLFSGVESDVLPDGGLDYADDVLARLDYAVASIHSHFHLDRTAQTQRLCRALAHPAVKILGHPTGRLLLGRDGYPVDMEEVLRCAAKYRKAVEINANPHRLDLDWTLVGGAQRLGIPICINPDAHEASHLEDVRYGVWAARKGLLLKKNCVNAWSVGDIETFFGGNR